MFTERGKRGENAFESKNMFSQIAPFPSLRGALSSSAGAASSGKGAHTPEWRARVFGLCCGVIEISHSSRLKMYTNRMVFLVSSSSSVYCENFPFFTLFAPTENTLHFHSDGTWCRPVFGMGFLFGMQGLSG